METCEKIFEVLDKLNACFFNNLPIEQTDEDLVKSFIKENNFEAIAQINLTAGDLKSNSEKIIRCIKFAESIGVKSIFFPKNTLMGYFMPDFIKRYPFILDENKKWLDKIAQNTSEIIAYVGYSDETGCKYAKLNKGEIVDKNVELDKKLEINQVGAIDNTSFEGRSCVYDDEGNVLARAKDFEEQILVFSLEKNLGKIYSQPRLKQEKDFSLDYEWDLERTYKTLVQGIRDYFKKCGLKRAVLGLSGGLDSTVSAVLLVDALGKENVLGVSMPSKLTSDQSKTDAQELASNLGIAFLEYSIKPMVETLNSCLEPIFASVENNWSCRYNQSFTQDNIQARSRAMYLWAISNEFESCIPIATSDKSESYMGYATINGDMSGGYAPILDITKTKLFALARWLNKNRKIKNVIPESVILKKPGAELAIDPNTGKTLNAEDALMPYEFLDEIIWRIENKHESYQQIMDSTFIYEKSHNITRDQKEQWLDKFYKRMSSALYKSYIMPPSIIVEENSINKTVYKQPITSGKVNYKGDRV